jgi:hypothetical protein
MKEKLKKISSAPKKVANHVYDRRGRYGFAAGIIAGGVITRNLDNETYKEAMAFLKLKGLTDEFFSATEHDYQDMVA